MKNSVSKAVRNTGLIGLFLMGTILVNAQSSKNDPSWFVSKDVQRVANKKSFENEAQRGSQLQAKSISQQWVISKGVNRPSKAEAGTEGNVRSKGIPAWTISKGVHQKRD